MFALVASAAVVLWLSRIADVPEHPGRCRGTRIVRGVVLALCVAAGLAVRLWDLDRSLWRDEFGTLWAVEGGLLQTLVRVTDFHGQTPFYYLFPWFLVHAVGESEVALRLPSLIFGTGAALLVASTGRLIAGPTAGLFAGIAAWLAAGLAGASVNARPYALGLFCCALAIHGFAGVATDGRRRYRWTFVLGAAGLVWTHYLFAPVLFGLVAGWAVFPTLRRRYPARRFAADCALVALLSAVALPQLVALWGRRLDLVWTQEPDFLAVARILVPLAVPALLASVSMRAPRAGAIERALWLCVVVQVGLLVGTAWAGANLLVPRYLDVIAVPAAILAGVGASRVGPIAQAVGVGFMVLLTGLGTGVVYRATGQSTVIPHEDWRRAVTTLLAAVATDPGPILLQAGFVEQTDGRTEAGSAVLAPLRGPGQPSPDVTVVLLPFSWDSAAASSQREGLVTALLLGGEPVYVLSGGGYTTLFRGWVNARFEKAVECPHIGEFVAVELVRCQASVQTGR